MILSCDLSAYEEKYGMPSEEFYAKYQAGVQDDDLQQCMEWTSVYIYKLFTKAKRKLELALMCAAVRQDFEEYVLNFASTELKMTRDV